MGVRVREDHVDKVSLICTYVTSCRGTAVTNLEPGLIGACQEAPLNDLFLNIYALPLGYRNSIDASSRVLECIKYLCAVDVLSLIRC